MKEGGKMKKSELSKLLEKSIKRSFKNETPVFRKGKRNNVEIVLSMSYEEYLKIKEFLKG